MLVAAVAPIDHRNGRILGGKSCGAIAGMADDHDIRVVRNHPHRVCEAFALGSRAGRGIGAGDDIAAEAQHGALEGQSRARARLVEQARQDRVRRNVGAPPDTIGAGFVGELVQKGLRDREYGLHFPVREIVDGDDVAGRRAGFRVGGNVH